MDARLGGAASTMRAYSVASPSSARLTGYGDVCLLGDFWIGLKVSQKQIINRAICRRAITGGLGS